MTNERQPAGDAALERLLATRRLEPTPAFRARVVDSLRRERRRERVEFLVAAGALLAAAFALPSEPTSASPGHRVREPLARGPAWTAARDIRRLDEQHLALLHAVKLERLAAAMRATDKHNPQIGM